MGAGYALSFGLPHLRDGFFRAIGKRVPRMEAWRRTKGRRARLRGRHVGLDRMCLLLEVRLSCSIGSSHEPGVGGILLVVEKSWSRRRKAGERRKIELCPST